MTALVSRFSITILMLVALLHAAAQLPCSFEHFSASDGLSQNRINHIIQDKNGFIWLGTYNGLIRYDGYKFKTYKANSTLVVSNRVNRITEDTYGRLWTTSADDILCFKPSTESFLLPHRNIDFGITPERIYKERSGKVWLVSKEEGCVCILDSLFNYTVYSKNNGKLPNCQLNAIYEDKELNTWLLTSNGLGFLTSEEMDSVHFIMNNKTTNPFLNKPFYTVSELNEEIWFGSKSGTIWRYLKKSRSFVEFQLDIDSSVRSIYKTDGKTLIILTQSEGFYTYNRENGELKKYDSTTLPQLESNELDYVNINKPYEMWFNIGLGDFYKFDLRTEKLKRYSVPIEYNPQNTRYYGPFVKKDIYNQLWIHPRGGGFSRYNRQLDQLEPFYNLPGHPDNRNLNIINSAYFDQQGILWMCTPSLGLEKVTFCKTLFESQRPFPKLDGTLTNKVRCIFEDKTGKIWLSTREGKLLSGNSDFSHLVTVGPTGKLNDDTSWPAAVYSINEDANNNIWLGSRGEGVFKLSPDKTGGFHVENYRHNPKDSYSLSNNNIFNIAVDHLNNIWIGTLGGGVNIVDNSNGRSLRFINHNNKLTQFPVDKYSRVRCIVAGANNIMYAGTSGGLLVWKTPTGAWGDVDFKHYESNPATTASLSHNEVMGLAAPSNGELYLATFGGGLNKVTKRDAEGYPTEFISYNQDEGLSSDLLLNVLTDKTGNYWVNSESSLVRFNPSDTTFESFKEIELLLSGGVFSEGASAYTSNGEIVFGHNNGIIRFKPEQTNQNTFMPKVILSNFCLYNKPYLNNDGIPLALKEGTIIELKHNQNFISIDFAALDLLASSNITYRYQLEGVDPEPNYTKDLRRAVYTNLPAGEYLFKVQSTNSSGIWVDNETSIPIVIYPSFWATKWAFALYILLILGLFFFIQRHYFIIYKLKSDVKFQKEISDIKLKFFTDISHEIRTPLTLITAPIEYLLNNEQTPKQVKEHLGYISNNTNRLLNLVNQILDYRKYQNQKLRIEKTNIGHFTEKICLEFKNLAAEKKLFFSFNDLSNNAIVWVDRNAFEKVIMNLLSNALKYNNSGNTIKVSIEKRNDHVCLSVSDNGPGISKSKQKELFNRFATFHEQTSNPSTGIGLSIIKEIVDKHHAKIKVESDEGQGSHFTIQFLNGYTHFGKDAEIILPENSASSKIAITNEVPIETDNSTKTNASFKPSILIVEDDEGLRNYIKTILIDEFLIYEAENGEEGLKVAIKDAPDFIVSDIMMPKMDGIAFLKALRANVSTSHIPVILLTAKTNIESKLDGLAYGADDYITKPFSVTYFKARVYNLLEQRKRLHRLLVSDYSINQEQSEDTTGIIVSADEELIAKAIDIINKNIDENGLTVEFLGTELGLSRSTFFNKLKSLTGMSPNEFIRDLRLQHAAKLILSQKILIKEACYMSGFSDLKYFGKCFKKKFGMPPGEYRSQGSE